MPLRRRAPVARLATTAVVAGTAANMGAKSAQRSAAAAQAQAAPPAPAPRIRRTRIRRTRIRRERANRTAQAVCRPQGPGHPHRGGVRRQEGTDPGALTPQLGTMRPDSAENKRRDLRTPADTHSGWRRGGVRVSARDGAIGVSGVRWPRPRSRWCRGAGGLGGSAGSGPADGQSRTTRRGRTPLRSADPLLHPACRSRRRAHRWPRPSPRCGARGCGDGRRWRAVSAQVHGDAEPVPGGVVRERETSDRGRGQVAGTKPWRWRGSGCAACALRGGGGRSSTTNARVRRHAKVSRPAPSST